LEVLQAQWIIPEAAVTHHALQLIHIPTAKGVIVDLTSYFIFSLCRPHDEVALRVMVTCSHYLFFTVKHVASATI
jgi:hypothetical protein